MKRFSVPRALFTVTLFGSIVAACYVEPAGPHEVCRTVEVRNRRDVEVCHTRCNNEGCHEHCREHERWAREHRCWMED